MPNYGAHGFAPGGSNQYYTHKDSLITEAYEHTIHKKPANPVQQEKGETPMVVYRKRGNIWTYRTTIKNEGTKKIVEAGGFTTKSDAESAFRRRYEQNPSKSA